MNNNDPLKRFAANLKALIKTTELPPRAFVRRFWPSNVLTYGELIGMLNGEYLPNNYQMECLCDNLDCTQSDLLN
jgi:hypothetical protein